MKDIIFFFFIIIYYLFQISINGEKTRIKKILIVINFEVKPQNISLCFPNVT